MEMNGWEWNGSLYSAGLCCIKMTAKFWHCNCSADKQENGFPHSSEHNLGQKKPLKVTQSHVLISVGLPSVVAEVAQVLPEWCFECFRGVDDTIPLGSLFQF